MLKKTPVDFYSANRELSEIDERGVPGTEVIDRNVNACLFQFFQLFGLAFIAAENLVLGQLHPKLVRLKIVTFHRFENMARKVWIGELSSR